MGKHRVNIRLPSSSKYNKYRFPYYFPVSVWAYVFATNPAMCVCAVMKMAMAHFLQAEEHWPWDLHHSYFPPGLEPGKKIPVKMRTILRIDSSHRWPVITTFVHFLPPPVPFNPAWVVFPFVFPSHGQTKQEKEREVFVVEKARVVFKKIIETWATIWLSAYD